MAFESLRTVDTPTNTHKNHIDWIKLGHENCHYLTAINGTILSEPI